jgi:hypothetical protein
MVKSWDQLKIVAGSVPEERTYRVEKILGHRETPDGYEYHVKWAGYDEESWEPQRNFVDWKILQDYWKVVVAGPGVLDIGG